MDAFTSWDIAAVLWFLATWLGQSWLTEQSPWKDKALSNAINSARHQWIARCSGRDLRMIDTAIMAGLQNGTAFFASTSLLAIGGGFTLLHSIDLAVGVVANLPVTLSPANRAAFEVKVIGLIAIYAYAFFKFGWAYRMFNYASILLGALPYKDQLGTPEMERAVNRCAAITVIAGKNFNRGLRAFFMSIGFLGWFIGPAALFLSASFLLAVLVRRQFFSDSVKALKEFA
ncbi:DUF599 domain-containing protein [Oryzibacter oryziterrae]|uniref:DUF599 domain-containing protein n=1 Tax=Oryzibacter oryziterrae TaxID=2766474 RepID=UPI001F1DF21B|nr:DUF599 family protein [Oryzibacter oryziterrae]